MVDQTANGRCLKSRFILTQKLSTTIPRNPVVSPKSTTASSTDPQTDRLQTTRHQFSLRIFLWKTFPRPPVDKRNSFSYYYAVMMLLYAQTSFSFHNKHSLEQIKHRYIIKEDFHSLDCLCASIFRRSEG
jgi:hypothetical protein